MKQISFIRGFVKNLNPPPHQEIIENTPLYIKKFSILKETFISINIIRPIDRISTHHP